MTDIVQRGTDSSGRPIYATAECWAVFDACCTVLGLVPTIVQGGWLKDAASASAATHQGDAFDIRLWDRTATERARMIHVFRGHAFAYWERTEAQGFDPHAHMVPGPWASPAPQALDQWDDYLKGRDGLAYHRPDYHPRPDPLVTTPPPEDDMFSDKDAERLTAVEADVQTIKEAVDRLEDAGTTILGAVRNKGENSWLRDVQTRKELKGLLREVLAELKADEG